MYDIDYNVCNRTLYYCYVDKVTSCLTVPPIMEGIIALSAKHERTEVEASDLLSAHSR